MKLKRIKWCEIGNKVHTKLLLLLQSQNNKKLNYV